MNIIKEQQQWLRERLAGAGAASPPVPRYLFIAWQSNRLGAQPYSANTLRTLLRGLASELQIRDSHGRLVDFQRTPRMRHTRATELLNGGVPFQFGSIAICDGIAMGHRGMFYSLPSREQDARARVSAVQEARRRRPRA